MLEHAEIDGRVQLKRFLLAFFGLSLLFIPILLKLFELSQAEDLYSHLPLIPIVSGYLVWSMKEDLPTASAPRPKLSLIPALLGCVIVIIVMLLNGPKSWQIENYLGSMTLAYVILVISISFCFFGTETLKAIQFPLAFLLCFIPLPTFAVYGLEFFFQYTSAEVAYWFIKLMDIAVLRESWLVFRLPTISIQVASECSGIRSSLVLFIVSLVASHLFLRSQWKRVFLVIFVIPLAIVRNALRVATIAAVCVHIGPEMIDSWVHKRGGPYFFALSMVPFMIVLYILLRSERKPNDTTIYEDKKNA